MEELIKSSDQVDEYQFQQFSMPGSAIVISSAERIRDYTIYASGTAVVFIELAKSYEHIRLYGSNILVHGPYIVLPERPEIDLTSKATAQEVLPSFVNQENDDLTSAGYEVIDVQLEQKQITDELRALESELREFEISFGIDSNEFYRQWTQGDLPDTFENNAWAILVEAKRDLLAKF